MLDLMNSLTNKGRGVSSASRTPQHVVITGATGGIGRALARHYAAPGRNLSLTGRNPERLLDIAAECQSLGADVMTSTLDVTDAEAMKLWLCERDSQIPVDILIANAGMGGDAVLPSPSGEDGELARRIVSVNTTGVINTVTPLLPNMVERQRGHIVLIGSISGFLGLPQSPVYCASKAAVQIYGDAIRRLVRQYGVRVTTVMPGFVDTPMSRSLNMPRPWCWSAEQAAIRIVKDVSRGARRCIFPWQLRLGISLANVLPIPVADLVLSNTTIGPGNSEH